MSGSTFERVAVVTASARNLPALIYSIDAAVVTNMICTCPASRSASAGRWPRYGTCSVVTPVIILNNSPSIWVVLPMPPDAILTLPGFALAIGDKLGNRLGRNRWMRHHDEGVAADSCDRRDVANEIEIELVVERRVDRVRRACHEQRVAARRRPHARLRADIAAGARPVLDNELLTEPLRQPLTDQAGDNVGWSARGKA